MPIAEATVLARTARAIADGKPVDWGRLEAEHPSLRARLAHLRRMQTLAATSRARLEAIAPAAEPASTAQACPFAWGPLQVLEKIGEGSFGEVFRARDPMLEREVALKLTRFSPLFESDPSQDHLDEARRLARVRHPNVLTVHGVEVHGGRGGFWTDFLRGETLEEPIRRGETVSADVAATIAADLCRALSAVHAAGIVHGDIKASNVFREADGRYVLMDFGAGTLVAAERDARGSSVAGTPLSMAPEVLEGARPSVASDLYAAGALLYRILAGRHPVGATTLRGLVAAHKKGRRIPLAEMRPGLPEDLARAIERALARDPSERYRDADEMGYAIVAAAERAPAAPAIGDERLRRLPEATDRFIGREREIASLRKLLVRSPVVTLVGPGGAGKTRLALLVAREMCGGYADGAFWVDLASVGDRAGVVSSFSSALSFAAPPKKALEEALIEHLAKASALVVLDNCEHLLEECARVVDAIRGRASGVRFLVTSRSALGVGAEACFDVPPLSVPPARAAKGGLEITDYESVRLFIDRAARSRQGFVLTRATSAAVASICRRLDGIPLAIELAAARVKLLSPEDIDARLERSIRVLGTAEGGRAPHQKTLEASIAWSCRLLSDPERALFRRLGVFAGRWTLEGAESVCRDAGSDDPAIGGESIIDLLASLIEKSLLAPAASPEDIAGGERGGFSAYRMLEMVRQFAQSELRRSGEAESVEESHLMYATDLSRKAALAFLGPDEAAWVRRLDWEHDDLVSVLRWVSSSPSHADEGMRMAMELRRYWYGRSRLAVGIRAFEALLEIPNLSALQRGRGLSGMATLMEAQGHDERALAVIEEALRIHRAEGDHLGIGAALGLVAMIRMNRGEFAEAVAIHEETLAIRRANAPLPWVAGGLHNLGVACAFAGLAERSRAAYVEALEMFERLGDSRSASQTTANLAATALDDGDLRQAKHWAGESHRHLRAVGEGLDTSGALGVLATVAREEGDSRTARSRLLEAVRIVRERGDARELARCLSGFASTCVLEEDWDRAARLFGALAAHGESVGTFLDPGASKRLARDEETARRNLGADRFEDLHAVGRALTLEQALALAGAGDALER